MKHKKRVVIVLIVAIIFLSVGWYMRELPRREQQPFVPVGVDLPQYFATTLMQYDGTNPELPIYLALDGYVYDVTPGREFYGVGGTYHALAGKDSSNDLHTFGGSLVKEKYKVVGVFAK